MMYSIHITSIRENIITRKDRRKEYLTMYFSDVIDSALPSQSCSQASSNLSLDFCVCGCVCRLFSSIADHPIYNILRCIYRICSRYLGDYFYNLRMKQNILHDLHVILHFLKVLGSQFHSKTCPQRSGRGYHGNVPLLPRNFSVMMLQSSTMATVTIMYLTFTDTKMLYRNQDTFLRLASLLVITPFHQTYQQHEFLSSCNLKNN